MILEAFAKINWSLDITGIRDDGYHLMDMLMQPVSLSDTIILEPAEKLVISSVGTPCCRADESNLAYRAALVLREETGCPYGASIHLEKRIPVCAGMGGGSSDAAAVLVGLNLLWKTGLPPGRLEEIGLRLGADVPFFIRGGLTRTRGIGELLESLDYAYNYWLIVIQPCSGLSTGGVFCRWHEASSPDHPRTEEGMKALAAGNLNLLCEAVGNVLQPVAEQMKPEIRQACSELEQAGAVRALMTGSGSAVFGVFRSSSAAEKAYEKLARQYKTIHLCHTQHDSVRVLQE